MLPKVQLESHGNWRNSNLRPTDWPQLFAAECGNPGPSLCSRHFHLV